MNVRRTERCWAGHFIAANRCQYRRNTLLELGDCRVVVSSVGVMVVNGVVQPVGCNRLAETMAFLAIKRDGYWEANVCKEVSVKHFCIIPGEAESDLPKNAGIVFDEAHEENVKFIEEQMLAGGLL